MKKTFFAVYYAVKSKVRHLLSQDDFEKRISRKYAGFKIKGQANTNEFIRNKIKSGEPFMAGRFGGFELLAMSSAEFDRKKKLEEAMIYLDRSAGFFPSDVNLLYKFNDVMKEACSYVDVLGYWFVQYEDYYIKKYCKDLKHLDTIMSLEPWKYMDNPWTGELAGKKVLVVHPFEDTIIRQYEKRKELFENPDMLPDFTLITYKAVQTSGSANDERFKTWFDALKYMCDDIDKLDFDIALVGCGAYGFPIAAHIKKIGRQAIHLGGVLQILFGIKGRRWDESDTSLLYNENWVYPSADEIPAGAAKVEGACYWAPEEEKNAEQ